MSLKIRLARGGAKKRPHYSIVVADSRYPRDGRFIEKLGTFDPMLPKDSAERVKMDMEKAKAWMVKGAQPTDRVARFLDAAGVLKRETRNNRVTEGARPFSIRGGAVDWSAGIGITVAVVPASIGTPASLPPPMPRPRQVNGSS